jgi:hypothetical protein
MSMSNTSENNLLLLLFNNTNWANLGDATGLRSSTTAGSFHISLHTADPGEAGSQTTSEISYTGYSRVAVARSGSGFTVTGASVSNAAAVTFGACTAGSGTATHFSIGRDASGTGEIIISGALSASLAISAGITPQFAIGQMTATAD